MPYQGFAHWRIRHDWIEQIARSRGDAWHHCRMILRLYDVSHIHFNGFNAHHIQDQPLPGTSGQMFFRLPRPGTWEVAEVGFLLRSGEFIPAARSQPAPFPPDAPTGRGNHGALLVTERIRSVGQNGTPHNGNGTHAVQNPAPVLRVEEVGNLWDQERILHERSKPKLRRPLRIALFALAARAVGQEGPPATFVSELAAGQTAEGHEVHVFVPAFDQFTTTREVAGAQYHPLEVGAAQSADNPMEWGYAFAQAVEKRLQEQPPFDLFHLHEWMTGLAPWLGSRPTVLSLTSIETTRRNGTAPSELSLEIQKTEHELARAVGCVLTPDWLRDQAIGELGLDGTRTWAFPMEGRLANEWECPLDFGQVKKEVGVGPLDRLIVFVGPLEHAAGVDLLVEALPTVLRRYDNLRLAFVGGGDMYGQLAHRCHQLGVAHAVRLLGHVEGAQLTRLLRSAAALALPSRYRVPFDDAVVDLARRASRPVVTTHGGPAHLVRHEENGLVTYDNPGSMVWALDRILGDPDHADRMGQHGRRSDGSMPRWSEVARHYLELCAVCFPELREGRMRDEG
jgi:glycosyltransferase involved in cell wall biosynthesis